MEPIASTLEKIVAGTLKRGKSDDGPLLAWPLACGSAVAERTRALSFRSGILSIEVSDPGWRAELMHLSPRYLVALNRYSPVVVNRIEFVVRAQKEGRSQK